MNELTEQQKIREEQLQKEAKEIEKKLNILAKNFVDDLPAYVPVNTNDIDNVRSFVINYFKNKDIKNVPSDKLFTMCQGAVLNKYLYKNK